MTNRLGPGRLLTPEQAEEQLAGPVFYLLAGFAQPVFPQSTLTAPSPFVLIQRIKGVPWTLEIAPRFPVSVNGKQWRTAVVPVLESPGYQKNTVMFRSALQNGNYRDLLAQIGASLRQSFLDAGYGPTT